VKNIELGKGTAKGPAKTASAGQGWKEVIESMRQPGLEYTVDRKGSHRGKSQRKWK
jgi:hypothetical protein